MTQIHTCPLMHYSPCLKNGDNLDVLKINSKRKCGICTQWSFILILEKMIILSTKVEQEANL